VRNKKDKGNVCRVLVVKSELNELRGRPKLNLKDGFKMDLKGKQSPQQEERC
jgi:hypothetical protein